MGILKRIFLAVSGLLLAGAASLALGTSAAAATGPTGTVGSAGLTAPAWGHRGCDRFSWSGCWDDCWDDCCDDCWDDCWDDCC